MQDSLTQTVDIETPELVVLSYTIAGLGSRVYAALIDLLICGVVMIAFLIGIVVLALHSAEPLTQPSASTAWAVALIILIQFAILWGYYLLFEGFNDGQTPGKRFLKLRVVRDGGYSVGFSASAVRNLMRIVDLQPVFTYALGIGSVLFSKSGKRLGDIVAGTIVVRESLIRQPVLSAAAPASSEAMAASLRRSSPTKSSACWNAGPSDERARAAATTRVDGTGRATSASDG
jgi:Predicted membrane protein/domain